MQATEERERTAEHGARGSEMNEPVTLPGQPATDAEMDALIGKLTQDEQHKPWFTTIFRDLKEAIFPPKLPPLEVTSKPIPVKDIWGFSQGQGRFSGLGSIAIHVLVVGLAIWLGTLKIVQDQVKKVTDVVNLSDYIPAKPAQQKMGGGGGGGDRSPIPVSKGKLPKPAPKQFVPPQIIRNEQPKLVMDPTIVAQIDAPLPKVDMSVFGDPLAGVHAPSNGTGSNGGMGSGKGGGVGSGNGQGVGPGSGGGFGGGAYRIGGGVSAPVPLFKPDPEYSEEARKAKFQGSVILQIVVDENGNPKDIKVVRPLGLGLDEKAIEAVQKWRFRAGVLNGKPVPVRANVEVNFRLL
jgi:protein TonB